MREISKEQYDAAVNWHEQAYSKVLRLRRELDEADHELADSERELAAHEYSPGIPLYAKTADLIEAKLAARAATEAARGGET